MKSDGKIENDLASIFFLGIYDIVSVYIISIPILYIIRHWPYLLNVIIGPPGAIITFE